MNLGDTLIIDEPGTSLDSHFWMVISDPSQNADCILVNLTSWRQDKDQSCVLAATDHPYINKRSCVNYPKSKREKVSDIERLIASNLVSSRDALRPEVLAKILKGAANSRMPFDHAQLLLDQGLI